MGKTDADTRRIAETAVEWLCSLISIPSFSREESNTATLLEECLQKAGVATFRSGNNVFARSEAWSPDKPVLLLNSHHDTVRPVAGWTRDPFNPVREDGRLYGLGSNDAGGCLVALMAVFLQLQGEADLPVNLIFAASAEEEVSGANGIAALLPALGHIDAAIVGEPTRMQMAVAEKGLLVIDATATGQAGHAAREEGINAIYEAMTDILFLRDHAPERVSPLLGKVKCTVTQINAGTQHNVIPDRCTFVIDVRTNELYSNEAILQWLQQHLRSELKPRSLRLNASGIALDHPLVESGRRLGLSWFGSPTLSDQALMTFPSVKIGCGDSARSHTADEYIEVAEIEDAINKYTALIKGIEWTGKVQDPAAHYIPVPN
jgi:acetylornithine deacetylase